MKKILITGANSGIGLALAEQLAQDGIHVFLGSRSAERGAAAVKSIADKGKVELVVLDVTSDESVKAAVEQLKPHAPLFAVVNNAGTWDKTDFKKTMDVNFLAVRRMVDNFVPLLQKGGKLIATGSGSASMYVDGGRGGATPVETRKKILTNPKVEWTDLTEIMQAELDANFGTDDEGQKGMLAYGCSKALMTAYHFIVSREHPELVVSVCSPGFIQTKLTAGMGASLTPEEGTKSLKKLLFEDLGGHAWIYYGSDALKSPLDVLRNPGEPEYEPAKNWWA